MSILPISIALTGLGYFTAYIFQRSYLTTYGIPADTFISVRPEVVIISIVSTAFLMYMLMQGVVTLFLNKQKARHSRAEFWRRTSVMAVFGFTFAFIGILNKDTHYLFWIFSGFAAILGILVMLRIIIIPLHVKLRTHDYGKSEQKFRILSWATSKPTNFNSTSPWEWVVLVAGSLIVLAGVASAAGSFYTKMFNYMPTYERGGDIYVVITNYNDSYIVKKYYEDVRTVSEEFYVVREIQEPLRGRNITVK